MAPRNFSPAIQLASFQSTNILSPVAAEIKVTKSDLPVRIVLTATGKRQSGVPQGGQPWQVLTTMVMLFQVKISDLSFRQRKVDFIVETA
jgi:hypothetical protein